LGFGVIISIFSLVRTFALQASDFVVLEDDNAVGGVEDFVATKFGDMINKLYSDGGLPLIEGI